MLQRTPGPAESLLDGILECLRICLTNFILHPGRVRVMQPCKYDPIFLTIQHPTSDDTDNQLFHTHKRTHMQRQREEILDAENKTIAPVL